MQAAREQLRAWLRRSKMKQKELARLLSVSEVYVSQLLKGIRSPGLANAFLIERHTGISAEAWLLSEVSPARVARRPRVRNLPSKQDDKRHAL
jgi:transcriptional regulator with XRE-family HTH domain